MKNGKISGKSGKTLFDTRIISNLAVFIFVFLLLLGAMSSASFAAIRVQQVSNDRDIGISTINDETKITTTKNLAKTINSLVTASNSKSSSQNRMLSGTTLKWTILIYIDADNNLEAAAIKDIKEMLKGAKNLPDCACVLIQIDRSSKNSTAGKGYTSEPLPGETTEYTGARRYRVTNNGTLELVQELGEVNMGSAKTLNDFVKWGRQQCPSEKVALIIWNHGAGDAGVAEDETNKKDILQLPEIRRVLEAYKNDTGKNLDLLGFDACLMSAAEVITEFTGLTKILVASEDVEPGDGWDYQALFREFGKNVCNKTEYDLGGAIVGTYGKYYDTVKKNKTTLVAIDMEQYGPRFQQTMKAFTRKLVSMLENETTSWEVARAIEWARNHSYEMWGGEQIDLYSFLSLLQRAVTDTQLRKLIQEVLDVILYMRFARHGGKAAVNATGISIYFKKNSSITYTYKGAAAIKFNKTTEWARVIKIFTDIYRNASYRAWLKANPPTIASPTEVIGSLFPATSENAPPTTPIFDSTTVTQQLADGFLFDGTLSIPNGLSFPDGGWVHIYEWPLGQRADLDPITSIWFDSLSSNTQYNFEFLWQPSVTGWVSLIMDFQPYQPNVWPQLPGESYDSSEFNFVQIEPLDPFYIPPSPGPALYPMWLIEPDEAPMIAGNTAQYGLEIINSGLEAYGGGSLMITATEIETQTTVTLFDNIMPSLSPGESHTTLFDFTPQTPGIYEFDVFVDNEPLDLPSNAPKEWFSTVPIVPVIPPTDIIDSLTANVLLNDSNQLYDPTELPFHETDWVNQDLFLEFELPTPVNPSTLPIINFTFNVGTTWAPDMYSAQGLIHPDNWTTSTDGRFTALIGPFPALSSSTFLSANPYRMSLTTNATGSENVLEPAFWEFMQLPNYSNRPDVILLDATAELDPFTGNLTATLFMENRGTAVANGTTAGVSFSALLPNGSFATSVNFTYGSLPTMNPGEFAIWVITISYLQFLIEGFHVLFVDLTYNSATYDRISKEVLFYHDNDTEGPEIDPNTGLPKDIVEEVDRELFNDDPLFGTPDSIEEAPKKPVVDGQLVDPFDEPFLEESMIESEVEAPTLENEDELFDVELDPLGLGPLPSLSSPNPSLTETTTTLNSAAVINNASYYFTIYAKVSAIPAGQYPIYVYFYDAGYNVLVISFTLIVNYNPVITGYNSTYIEIPENETGSYSVSWSIYDEENGTYEVYKNGTLILNGTWIGMQSNDINIGLGGLTAETYVFFINVTDIYGASANLTITVVVLPQPQSTTTPTSTPTSTPPSSNASSSETTPSTSTTPPSPATTSLDLVSIVIALMFVPLAFRLYRKKKNIN